MNKGHTSHPITGDIDQDHQRLVHQERDIGTMLLIGDTGMMVILTDRSDGSYSDKLTPSQWMEAKLFLDKIMYFDGSNNKEALNFLAQCEEATQKMKAPETTVAWSKLVGRADVVMREESRQHKSTVTWEVFQSMLIEHFYHIPSKERDAKLVHYSRIHMKVLENMYREVAKSFSYTQVKQI